MRSSRFGSIRFLEAGENTGTAYALVPGFGMSSRYMRPLMRELSSDGRVLAPDLPGFGRSSKPKKTLGVRELADAFSEWIAGQRVGEVHLVANSFGCLLAAEIASRGRVPITTVTLQAPILAPRYRSLFRLIPRFIQEQFSSPLSLTYITGSDYWNAGLSRIFATLTLLQKERIETRLPLIRCPALVLYGSRDLLTTPTWAAQVARMLPNAKLCCVAGMPHSANFSSPRAVADAVRQFTKDTLHNPNTFWSAPPSGVEL